MPNLNGFDATEHAPLNQALENDFKPNRFQEAIFHEVENGNENLIVQARAGTGKTVSILRASGLVPGGKSVLFCAFNKAIQLELEARAPSGVDVKTLHSLGYGCLRRTGKFKVDADRTRKLIREYLDERDEKCIRGRQQALYRLISLSKNTLINDRDQLVDIAYSFGIEDYLNPAELIVDEALDVLKQCRVMNGVIDFDDMIWLPAIYDLKPRTYDVVFVDECQDLNNCQLWMIRQALRLGGRLIAVGDPRQCQPPGTMVSIPGGNEVPIENLRNGHAVVAWDRHAKALVGREKLLYPVTVESREYVGDLISISVPDGKTTRCTPNHRWTVKTERSVDLWAVYLMKRRENFRIGWCQLFNKGRTLHLGHRTRLEKADSVWILSMHRSKRDASIDESLVSYRFNIPLVQFTQSVASPTAGLLDQNYMNEFWEKAGSQYDYATECLDAHRKSINFPFYTVPGKHAKQRRTTVMEVVACNLFSEFMQVPIMEGKNIIWSSFKKEIKHYRGKVFSLDEPVHGHYVADGIVTHNSIYGFRGAGSNVIDDLTKEFHAKVLPLSITYRCPKRVVNMAREIVPDYEAADTAPDGIVEDCNWDDCVNNAEPGCFVLSRKNAPLMTMCLSLLARGVPAKIAGKDIGKNLIALAEKSKTENVPELRDWLSRYRSKEEKRLMPDRETAYGLVCDKVECLNVMMEGVSATKNVAIKIDKIFSDTDSASVVMCSSVHKAKGLERSTVWVLVDTFRRHWNDEEDNLWYVALTRSKNTLMLVSDKDPE